MKSVSLNANIACLSYNIFITIYTYNILADFLLNYQGMYENNESYKKFRMEF